MKTKLSISSSQKKIATPLLIFIIIGILVVAMNYRVYLYSIFDPSCRALVGATFRTESKYAFEGEMYESITFGIGVFYQKAWMGGIVSSSSSGHYECALGKILVSYSYGNTLTGQINSTTSTLTWPGGGTYTRTSGP